MQQTLGSAALEGGILVALLTVASQTTVPLPFLRGDFANLAAIGLAVAAFGAFAASISEVSGRRRALLGVGLALAPVVLLAYFLLFTVS